MTFPRTSLPRALPSGVKMCGNLLAHAVLSPPGSPVGQHFLSTQPHDNCGCDFTDTHEAGSYSFSPALAGVAAYTRANAMPLPPVFLEIVNFAHAPVSFGFVSQANPNRSAIA